MLGWVILNIFLTVVPSGTNVIFSTWHMPIFKDKLKAKTEINAFEILCLPFLSFLLIQSYITFPACRNSLLIPCFLFVCNFFTTEVWFHKLVNKDYKQSFPRNTTPYCLEGFKQYGMHTHETWLKLSFKQVLACKKCNRPTYWMHVNCVQEHGLPYTTNLTKILLCPHPYVIHHLFCINGQFVTTHWY